MPVSPATTQSDAQIRSDRRLQILAALDIDVWQVRSASAPIPPGKSPQGQSPEASGKNVVADSSAGPAGARAVLAELTGAPASSGNVPPVAVTPGRVQNNPAPAVADGVAHNPSGAPSASASAAASNTTEPALDLWCLSGPHGVLLADQTGLSPHAQRLLNDIFQAAMRQIAGRLTDPGATPASPAIQQLRFSWPPADQAGSLQVAAPTVPALRGFLSRQLQNKSDAVVLVSSSVLAQLLTEVALDLPGERLQVLQDVDGLLADGEAKRALWQTLKTL